MISDLFFQDKISPDFRIISGDVFFGKISSGLVWLKNNPLKAKEIAVKGQKYVQDKYSPKFVSLMWAKAINKIL